MRQFYAKYMQTSSFPENDALAPKAVGAFCVERKAKMILDCVSSDELLVGSVPADALGNINAEIERFIEDRIPLMVQRVNG